MEKYRLVGGQKGEGTELAMYPGDVKTGPTEIRITQKGKPRNYISDAMNLFVRIAATPVTLLVSLLTNLSHLTIASCSFSMFRNMGLTKWCLKPWVELSTNQLQSQRY